jgi:hypothetical protein
MQKLLLVSIIAGIIALPAVAARDSHPVRALKKVLLWIAALDVAYYLAIRFVYPHLF